MATKTRARKKQPAKQTTSWGLIGAGTAAMAAGLALVGYLVRLRAPSGGEHPAPDLAPDQPHPGSNDRAPEDFRPDPTAAVPAGERDAFRPALAG